ncbi:MAG TPA: HAD family hydrolase [Amaricoccus sp.]|nr:HAD family hydrolase [Amaricoccus sp.]
MRDLKALSGRKLPAPRALLLDFGGVIVETAKVPGWEALLAGEVARRLEGVADAPGLEQVARDIGFGARADSHWKDAMSRPFAPRELTHAEFWGDFVAADWPAAARAAVVADATELCRRMGHLRSARTLRDGMLDLLDAADLARVPVGIVSNALSGRVHLDWLEENGLAGRFAVEIHSDEAGVRKPNPEMIHLATRALGIDPGEAWYVGDNFDRDVLCGRRAGVGGIILMEAKGTWDLPYELDLRPDAIVAGPRELHALFSTAFGEVSA